ncbi:MAG: AAA family ATPase [candidate division Zixibacteria bacterium]|nr:AAA family ATPase [candidate division Zixibacteria bacterium]MBU1471157.1 AAA family ATPase [candidate division Zixibacteria bacterium]MBU2625852.1 AAA family ATPase [candidate division Zixibacteria bacterium]
MLQEIKIDNFMSLINVVFEPKDANLVVGVNNAGKTNLTRALMFLSSTAWRPLDECAQFIGIPIQYIRNVYYKKQTVDISVKATVPFEDHTAGFAYSLRISFTNRTTPVLEMEVDSESLIIDAPGFESVELLNNTREGVSLLNEIDHLKGETKYVKTFAPRNTTMLHRLYDLETNKRSNCFKRYLQFWQSYELDQSALRGGNYIPNDFLLNHTGGNLASVIYHLKKSNEQSYRVLLDCVKMMEPDLEYINFFGGDDQRNVAMSFDYKSQVRLPGWTASSGTLRFLALAYVLLAQPLLQSRPLIMVEEPENGIYVGLLKEILSMALEGGGPRPQLLFTSHSPYFVDLFDKRLDSVFVMKRDEYASKISRIDAAEAENRLKEYPLGEQHFWEMLT